jgi:hypothetical protein
MSQQTLHGYNYILEEYDFSDEEDYQLQDYLAQDDWIIQEREILDLKDYEDKNVYML